MSGYTRVSEIVGESAARAIGDAITDARNEAFLRDVAFAAALVGSSDASVLSSPGDRVTVDSGSTAAAAGSADPSARLPPAPSPEVAVDLGEARRRVSALALSRSRSLDRDDRVAAVVIRRALDGDPLARAGDPETVLAGASDGLSPEAAVRSAVWSVALALPLGAPFGVAREILQKSLRDTPDAPSGGWLAFAETAYRRAMRSRRASDAKAAIAEARFKAAVLADAGPRTSPSDGGSGGAGGTPPPSTPFDDEDPNAWKDLLRKRADGSLSPIPQIGRAHV